MAPPTPKIKPPRHPNPRSKATTNGPTVNATTNGPRPATPRPHPISGYANPPVRQPPTQQHVHVPQPTVNPQQFSRRGGRVDATASLFPLPPFEIQTQKTYTDWMPGDPVPPLLYDPGSYGKWVDLMGMWYEPIMEPSSYWTHQILGPMAGNQGATGGDGAAAANRKA